MAYDENNQKLLMAYEAFIKKEINGVYDDRRNTEAVQPLVEQGFHLARVTPDSLHPEDTTIS